MKHTVKNWFPDKTLYKYFNEDFKRNKVGTLAFPKSMINSWTRNNQTIDQAMIDKMTDSLGQSIIDAIVKKHFNMIAFEFKYMMKEHQEYLREAVCYEMQEVIYNKKVMERNGGANISTPSFTIGVDSTNWFLTYDEISIRAKELVALADISNYKVVGNGFIGRVAYNTAKSEVVMYKWNNEEFGKELNEPGYEGKPYDNWQHASTFIQSLLDTYPDKFPDVDKYDYIYLTIAGQTGLYRFEGGDWKDFDNWDRKDVKAIDGERYLVYKNYMMMGVGDEATAKATQVPSFAKAQNGYVLAYNKANDSTEWVRPNLTGDFTKILPIAKYSDIDLTVFDKWYLVDKMESKFGTADDDSAIVYVANDLPGGIYVWPDSDASISKGLQVLENKDDLLAMMKRDTSHGKPYWIKDMGGLEGYEGSAIVRIVDATKFEIMPTPEEVKSLRELVVALGDDLEAVINANAQAVLYEKAYADAIAPTVSVDGKTLTIKGVVITTPWPNEGVQGEMHLENADGSEAFNLPWKFNKPIADTFRRADTDQVANLTIVDAVDNTDNTKRMITITSDKIGFFTDLDLKITKIWTNAAGVSVSLSSYMKTADAKALFQLKQLTLSPDIVYYPAVGDLVAIMDKSDLLKNTPAGEFVKIEIDKTKIQFPSGGDVNSIPDNGLLTIQTVDNGTPVYQNLFTNKGLGATNREKWLTVKNSMDKYYFVLEKHANDPDNAGNAWWTINRYEAIPKAAEPIKVEEIINPADPMSYLGKDDTISFRVEWPNLQIDTSGGASFPGNFTFLDKNGVGTIESSSHQSGNEVRATAAGIEIWRAGVKQRGPYAWNTLKVVVTKIKGDILPGDAGTADVKFGTLEELYKVEEGVSVVEADKKPLNLVEQAELLKDQREYDLKSLAIFSDYIYYRGTNHIQYVDKDFKDGPEHEDFVTTDVLVTANGNTLNYNLPIDPIVRINQEGANFKFTFNENTMEVKYEFASTPLFIRFKGSINDWYQWTNVGSVVNGARVQNIKFDFSPGVTMETSANGSIWTAHNTGFMLRYTDMVDGSARGNQANVSFTFATLPNPGPVKELASIQYQVSNLYVEIRYRTIVNIANRVAKKLTEELGKKLQISVTPAFDPVNSKDNIKIVVKGRDILNKEHYYEVDPNNIGLDLSGYVSKEDFGKFETQLNDEITKGLKEAFDSMEFKVDKTEFVEAIAKLNQKDAAIDAEIAKKASSADLATAQSDIADNAQEIVDIKVKIGDVEVNIQDLDDDIQAALVKLNKAIGDITGVSTDVATNLASINTNKASIDSNKALIVINTNDIATVKNAASLVDLLDLSANLPITSAKIKAALVASNHNLPNGDSQPGQFVLLKEDASGMVWEYWLADTSGGWYAASTKMEFSFNAFQKRAKNSIAATGYSLVENGLFVGNTTDDPSWVAFKDFIKTIYATAATDENKYMVLDADGKPVFKKINNVVGSDLLRDIANKEVPGVVVEKGDIIIAEEVDTDGNIIKVSGSNIKPMVALLDSGGVDPAVKEGQVPIGGKTTRELKYIAKPAAGKNYKFTMKDGATEPVWEEEKPVDFTPIEDALKLKANVSHDWLVTTIETTSPGFFIFDETPAIDKLPYEAEVKVTWPDTITGTFGDTDQVQSLLPGATATERVILNVAGTNVMNYSELKNDFDKYMILIKKEGSGTAGAVDQNDYWQFVKFEAKPDETKYGVVDLTDKAGEKLWNTLEVDKFYIIKTKTSTTEDAISDEKVIIKVYSKDDTDGIKFIAIALDNTFHSTGEITFAKPIAGNTTDLPEVIAAKVIAAGDATETIIKNVGKVSDYMPDIAKAEAENRIVRFWHEAPTAKKWKEAYEVVGQVIDVVAVSPTGQYMVIGAYNGKIYVSNNYGATWTAAHTNGGRSYSASISLDGKYMLVSSSNSKMYTSDDFGVTWTEHSTTGSVQEVSMSSDGQHMLAGSTDRKLYVSNDFGVTWTTPKTTGNMVEGVAVSSNGKYMAAGSRDNHIYVSSDSGATWTDAKTIGDWPDEISISSDGEYMVVGSKDKSIYVSNDFGVTWTAVKTASGPVSSVDISENGKYIVAGGSYPDKKIYISSDSGATWTEHVTRGWINSVSISSDGKYMLAGSQDKHIYTSDDYGATWVDAKTTNREVKTVSVSSDGQFMIAGSSDHKIYISGSPGVHHHALVTEVDKEESKVYTTEQGKTIEIANLQLGTKYHLEIEVTKGTTIVDGTSTDGETTPKAAESNWKDITSIWKTMVPDNTFNNKKIRLTHNVNQVKILTIIRTSSEVWVACTEFIPRISNMSSLKVDGFEKFGMTLAIPQTFPRKFVIWNMNGVFPNTPNELDESYIVKVEMEK